MGSIPSKRLTLQEIVDEKNLHPIVQLVRIGGQRGKHWGLMNASTRTPSGISICTSYESVARVWLWKPNEYALELFHDPSASNQYMTVLNGDPSDARRVKVRLFNDWCFGDIARPQDVGTWSVVLVCEDTKSSYDCYIE